MNKKALQKKISLNEMRFGVSFSQKMSEKFGLDWKENYKAIVKDLHPTGIRLMAYWDLIEPKNNQCNFADLDWQVNLAQENNIPVIITIGQKVPRWPECHFPSWLDKDNENLRRNELLIFEKKVVERYKSASNLLYWQVENEPYISFGQCPKPDKNLVKSEISLVKKIDSHHKILLTDGGEWGKWYRQVKDGDVFGTTMYRKVYKDGVGNITPPLTPEYYEFKRLVAGKLTGKPDHPFIVSELGTEPWWGKQIYELPLLQQKKLLSNEEIDQFIDFARRSNFDTVYLWGAEWWYFMKTRGDASYWEHVKRTMNK